MWSSKLWLGLAGAVALLAPAPAPAAVDLAALDVAPQEGQSAERARRDRYECHNWAVEQSGEVPLAAPSSDEPTRTRRSKRRARDEAEVPGDYLRALTACLEGRGYTVTLPAPR